MDLGIIIFQNKTLLGLKMAKFFLYLFTQFNSDGRLQQKKAL